MKVSSGILLLLALFLAACSPSAAPTSTPAVNTSQAEAPALQPGEFSMTISGGIVSEIAGQALAQVSSSGSPEQSLTLIMFVSGAVDAPARGVTVVMPADIAPGTYPIKSYYSVFDSTGKVTGVGALFSEPGTIDEAASLFDASGGELQLTGVNPLNGTLKLDTASPETTLHIEGSFVDAPIITAP